MLVNDRELSKAGEKIEKEKFLNYFQFNFISLLKLFTNDTKTNFLKKYSRFNNEY